MRVIKMIVMDVDGTLTDGKIYMSANGEIMKAFNVKDGYGIKQLRDYGIEPVIITGRESEIVRKRAEELKIKELHQGVDNKLLKLKGILEKYQTTFDEIAYIGDDLNDLECIKRCRLSGCPIDAISEVKSKVNYICKCKGGQGAVREFIEYIIKLISSST